MEKQAQVIEKINQLAAQIQSLTRDLERIEKSRDKIAVDPRLYRIKQLGSKRIRRLYDVHKIKTFEQLVAKLDDITESEFAAVVDNTRAYVANYGIPSKDNYGDREAYV